MEKEGICLEDCRVVAYGFQRETLVGHFHYLLLAQPMQPYFLFDKLDGVAQLVIRNDDAVQQECDRLARILGGEPTNPKLL